MSGRGEARTAPEGVKIVVGERSGAKSGRVSRPRGPVPPVPGRFLYIHIYAYIYIYMYIYIYIS